MAAGAGPQWLGLLKWSLEHSDGTAPSTARPLNAEDRAWLERVMKEGVRDDVKIMTECYEELCRYLKGEPLVSRQEGETDAERTEIVLLELQDITEQIDMANVFLKIGGTDSLLQATTGASFALPVRCQAALCIAAVTHNNLKSQDAFLHAGAFLILRQLVANTAEPEELRAKALGALGAVVRGHAAGETLMAMEEGISLLTTCLQDNAASTSNALRRKALFLARALASSEMFPSTSALRPLLAGVIASLEAGEMDVDLRETSIELLVACKRADSGVEQELGGRVAELIRLRRAALKDVTSDEQKEDAEAELSRWAEWEESIPVVETIPDAVVATPASPPKAIMMS